MAKESDSKEREGIELKVKRSPISGSGIARINIKVLEKGGFQEGAPVLVTGQKEKKRVLRLVADKMMERTMVSLRLKDMDKLGVSEGDKVTLSAMEKISDRFVKKILGVRK